MEELDWDGTDERRLAEVRTQLERWRNRLSSLHSQLDSLKERRRATQDRQTFKALDAEIQTLLPEIPAATGRVRKLEQEYNSMRDEVLREQRNI
jgi:predicted  nucleic acid-binding Zn-ribbon protein